MNIIIRTCGERTERRCIELARMQGTVHVVRAIPFGECLRQSYALALKLGDDFTPMIDGDVILSPGVLDKAIRWMRTQSRSSFCLDGKTHDKIMMRDRRAGIHIYRTALLPMALKYVDDTRLKPESHVRKSMEKHGHGTIVGPIVFGYHDYEQYYRDLWRKSVAQCHKLAGLIRRSNIRAHWDAAAKKDADYRVIIAGHHHGSKLREKPMIDVSLNYGAAEGLKALGLEEKGELK